jgi:hypothetical protein
MLHLLQLGSTSVPFLEGIKTGDLAVARYRMQVLLTTFIKQHFNATLYCDLL